MVFFQQLATRLRFGPGVSVVSVSDSLPPTDGHGGMRYGEILVEGRPRSAAGPGAVVRDRWVSPEYFRALDIPIVRGEGFRDEDLGSKRSFCCSESTAGGAVVSRERILSGERLNFDHVGFPDAPWYTVAGVAANVKNGGLTGEDGPEFYRLRRNREEDWAGRGVWGQTAVVVVRSSLPAQEMSRWIRSQVAALDPTLPVDIATLRERVSKLADQPRFQTTACWFFCCDGIAAGGDRALWGDVVSGGAADAGDWRAHGAGCGEKRYSAAGDGRRVCG